MVERILFAPGGATEAKQDDVLAALAAGVGIDNFPSTYPLPDVQIPPNLRELTHVPATVTGSGNTTIYTPAAGKAIRLWWIYALNDPMASSAPIIKINLGATEIYRAWALSKGQRVTGPVDGPLVINLSQAANVVVTALLEEI